MDLANLARLFHVSLLEAVIAPPGAELALQPPRPSVWWSSNSWPWYRQHTVCGQFGEQDIAGLLDAVQCAPRTAASHPGY